MDPGIRIMVGGDARGIVVAGICRCARPGRGRCATAARSSAAPCFLAAAAAGGLIGWQREWSGKQAGPRTHMLVALGAAMLVLAAVQAGMAVDQLSRVMQGIAEGVGFIGGGVILKLTQQKEVRGLTTAAGLWMTAALGVAAGLGRYVLVILGTALAYFILAVVRRWEVEEDEKPPRSQPRDGAD